MSPYLALPVRPCYLFACVAVALMLVVADVIYHLAVIGERYDLMLYSDDDHS